MVLHIESMMIALVRCGRRRDHRGGSPQSIQSSSVVRRISVRASTWFDAGEAIVDAALREVKMSSLTGCSWHTLSGGERQRLHIARALAQPGNSDPRRADQLSRRRSPDRGRFRLGAKWHSKRFRQLSSVGLSKRSFVLRGQAAPFASLYTKAALGPVA